MDNTPAVPAQKRDCPFCEMAQERIVFETEVIRALWDLYPATPGHALLIPKRHVENWFLASEHEQQALMLSIDRLRREIEKRYCPDGFNIGINVGPAAGQTVFHLHVHVIPRYLGDVRYPQGGVRHVIPSKAVYGTMSRETLLLRDQPSKERSLVSGDADPLLPHLCADFDKAYRIDIAVAFILKSGVSLIQEHLRDLLDRGGTIRVLTGDYLDVTDPQALRMLSDLGDGIQQRVFDASTQSFHPKAFIVYFPEGGGVAYVGSSNLSESALNRGVEWNYKVIPFSEQNGFVDVVEAFEKLYHHPKTAQVDDSWLAKYEARRQKRQNPELAVPTEMPDEIPHPHSVQEEALRALAISRQQGHQAGLVVLATGLGKTWLSAFDTFRSGLKKILFVAHREEILNQSISTFRRIHQNKSFGRYDGNQKRRDVDVLFGSIQTLGRIKHLDSFARDAFDYIVIDEFHHAAARTYRNLIDYFDPQFLLGLTATPERSDGGDLMALCQDNLIYRKDLFDGIEAGLLSVFDYFGVPDEVDYANIPWRNSRFDERALTDAVATQKRAENVMEHYREKAGQRALGFCCSTLHADFMAKYFQKHGVRAVAVHSGPNSHPRAASLDRLREGGLEIVFAVDMFNEGVDIPSIDTVMMLRPTESVIIWLQQFGRGLRKAKNKSKLKVIDYIGNHRTFLTKVRALFHLGLGEGEIEQVLNLLAGQGTGDDQERLAKLLPSGCDVTYDMQSIEILRSLLKPTKNIDLFESYYLDFKFRLGQRPTARQAFRDGFNPSSLKIAYDTWFSFVQAQGGMDGIQKQVVDNYRLFLKELETTRMTKSYKMVLLLAMLREDCLPGGGGLEQLVEGVQRVVRHMPVLVHDFSVATEDSVALRRLLLAQPIDALTKVRSNQRAFFKQEGERLVFMLQVEDAQRECFQDIVRELVDWRLADYLSRLSLGINEPNKKAFIGKLSQSNGRPMVFLPDRSTYKNIPRGQCDLLINKNPYSAHFAKIALNVIKGSGGEENRLPEILKGWFGPNAGQPGTKHQVCFEYTSEGWSMKPVGSPLTVHPGIQLWGSYMRERIPTCFGTLFNQAIWRQGFVVVEKRLFLLVTLEKEGMQQEHRYEDRFLDNLTFQWQSQNRNKQDSKHGKMILNHEKLGIEVLLFIRRQKKVPNGKAAPFTFCGPVDFVSWEGEKPITVKWKLRQPLPESYHSSFMR